MSELKDVIIKLIKENKEDMSHPYIGAKYKGNIVKE